MDKETKKQLDAIEKTVYRIEQDTIKIRKELKEHIAEIWAIYKPLKSILKPWDPSRKPELTESF